MDESMAARCLPNGVAGRAGGPARVFGDGRGFTLIELLVVVTLPFRKGALLGAPPPN